MFAERASRGQLTKQIVRESGAMHFDPERVRRNVREATTEDLLDRATVYRAGMEPEALEIIDAELRKRGLTAGQIADHAQERRAETRPLPDGTVVRCSFCYRPAVAEGWGWHRLWGLVPIFPRFYYYCSEHRPDVAAENEVT
jgi:hypothetical protein